MKISTIMVCRNAEATIAGAILSFLAQDHAERELVVVDGASTDRTMEVVARYADPRIRAASEPDGGIYDAMNRGLGRMTGDAFGFLNADDRYHDAEALSRIAGALEETDMVTGDLDFVRAHDGTPPCRVWRASGHRPGAFRRGWMPAHPPTYARRSVWERVGGFDPTFRHGGDYDWMLRALEVEGVSLGVIDATLVDMAVGGASTAGVSAKLTNAREMARSRRRHLGTPGLDLAAVLMPFRKLPQVLAARGRRLS